MKLGYVKIGLAAVMVTFWVGAAHAGPISSACMQSKRAAASASLCSCIQKVADRTLKSADQRRVATFFRDPDRAQTVRMSTRSADDAFWERYSAFGAAAEAQCSAG